MSYPHDPNQPPNYGAAPGYGQQPYGAYAPGPEPDNNLVWAILTTVLCCLPEGHPYGRHLAELGFLSQVRYTGEQEMKVIALERAGNGPLMTALTKKGLRAHIMLGDTDWV